MARGCTAHGLVAEDGRSLGSASRCELGNIVISREGVPKLIDSTLPAAEPVEHHRRRAFKRKLHCWPPSSSSGRPFHRHLPLGVRLYWMSTGRPPSTTKTRPSLKLHQGHVTRPTELVEDYPVELEEIVFAALATDPERRWSTAESWPTCWRRFASVIRSMRP